MDSDSMEYLYNKIFDMGKTYQKLQALKEFIESDLEGLVDKENVNAFEDVFQDIYKQIDECMELIE